MSNPLDKLKFLVLKTFYRRIW